MAAAKKKKQDRLHHEGQPNAEERRRQQEQRAREMIQNLRGGLLNIGNIENRNPTDQSKNESNEKQNVNL